jgi:hypothetical protein
MLAYEDADHERCPYEFCTAETQDRSRSLARREAIEFDGALHGHLPDPDCICGGDVLEHVAA